MKEKPFLSVIVPAFQAEATIEGCLKAILSQKVSSDFEVVVVDDHSSDRTAEIAGGFDVKLIRLDENRGAGAARNLGAADSKGEVILFADADVFLEPEALESAVQVFKNSPDVHAAVGTYTELPAFDDPVSIYHNLFTYFHHDLSEDWIEWFWGALGAVRRDVFEKVGGFSEAYRGAAAEDIELGYAMARQGFRIAFRRDIRGSHARRFSLREMLFNDYRKAVLGTKLYLTRKETGRHAHGFSNVRNGISLVIMYPFLLALLTFLVTGQSGTVLILCMAALSAVNYPFYRFMRERGVFLLQAVGLHWLGFAAIAAGVVMGFVGLILGRPVESDSPWL